VPCPLSYTHEDEKKQVEDEELWGRSIELLADFMEDLGMYQGWKGWVDSNSYGSLKARFDSCVESFLDQYAKTDEERQQWLQVWPFTDR
jgi:hypothetical protein